MVDPRENKYQDLLHIGPDRIEKEDGLVSGKFLFNKEHVLYSKIRPYLRKVALPEFSGLCSADMYPVRAHEKYLTREFLWSILISPAFTSHTQSIPGRANIPKINRKEFAAYECILPPLELQKKYSDLFRRIQVFEKKNVKMNDYHNQCFYSLTQRAFRGEL